MDPDEQKINGKTQESDSLDKVQTLLEQIKQGLP